MADSLSRSLGQRNALAIVVEHVFDFDRGRTDVNDLVAAIDNVAFDRDEYVAVLREEFFLGVPGFVGEAKELEVGGRGGGGGGGGGRADRAGVLDLGLCDGLGNLFGLGHKNVAAGAGIPGLLGLGEAT